MKRPLTVAVGVLLASVAAVAHGAPTTFQILPLVSDQAGVAPNTDPDLVNAWGLSQAPGGPLWVSDNGTNLSTLYDRVTGQKQALTVAIPNGAPTGQVYAPSGFDVTEGGVTGHSVFIFDTETGFIEGWAPSVDGTNAIVAVDNSAKGSVYKGLAISTDALFAADFVNNQVQVFDSTFKQIKTFTDASLPKNYAPFNVAFLNGDIYVAFAKREKHGFDELHGKGLGYVDVFTTKGKLKSRLIANGKLNAPWALAIAPSSFGTFAGALLVGNFGDGKVNAYDSHTGAFMGTLSDSNGKSLVIDGLWALDPGPNNDVTFSAGPDDEAHGLIGLIHPN